jgi:uncharacterized protein YodC (DUF2158 family)
MSWNPPSFQRFRIGDLKLVAPCEQFQDVRQPPLRLGDVVRLNSGGPASLVVDLSLGDKVTISWCDTSRKAREIEIPRACVHRVQVAD